MQRGGQQRAHGFRHFLNRFARLGKLGASARDDDGLFGSRDHLDQFFHQCRVRLRALRRRQIIGRWDVIHHMRIGLLLQVHRNADHDRAAFQRGEMKGFTHIIKRAIHGFDRDMMRARCLRQRRHINLLDVIGRGDR